MRPVIIIVLVVLILVTWIVFGEVINVDVDLLGVIATSLAFFATAWAAHEARKSAKAAVKAVTTADETLKETRKNYQRDAFEKRYSLLLEQHNQQLKNVVEFLSSETDEAKRFIDNINERKLVLSIDKYLSGHSILSPYMRTLYHLLKHINENFYLINLSDDELIKRKKDYSSPLRSLIRNDVLYLIALNCLVTKSKDEHGEVDNGYGYYQWLLNYFDFFEHAVFFDWRSNVRINDADEHMREYLNDRYISYIKNALMECFRKKNYSVPNIINHPLLPPVYLAMNYVYKTAANEVIMAFFADFESQIKALVKGYLNSARSERHKAFEELKTIKGMYVGDSYKQTHLTCRVGDSLELMRMAFIYQKNSSLKIQGITPLYFLNSPHRLAGNSFTSDVVFDDRVKQMVQNYFLYSNIVSLSKSNIQDSFVDLFVGESIEYIKPHQSSLADFISECQG